MDQTIYNKARRDKFAMVFDLPLALKKRAFEQAPECQEDLKKIFKGDHIQFSIYGTPVPRVTVNPVDMPYAGQVHRNTSFTRPTYSPLVVGLNIDNKFLNYWLLWMWLDLWNNAKQSIFSPGLNQNTIVDTSIADFVTSFTIYGLDEYNNKVISFYYKNVVLTELSEIEFSYRSTEEIGCTATFVFDQMTVQLLQPDC